MSVERFSSRYEDILDLQVQVIRYAPVREAIKGQVILDLGCGSGYSSKILHDWGAKKVLGIDIDPKAIEAAEEKFGASNALEFICGPAEQINTLVDFSIVDGICFVECIEHVLEPELVLRKLATFKRADTWIYITAPNDGWSYRFSNSENSHHLRRFSKKSFATMTEPYLGVPNSLGEFHGTLGLLSLSDTCSLDSESTLGDIDTLPNFALGAQDSPLNSEDALGFYASWQMEVIEKVSLSSPQPMDIYTHLFDRAVYSLPQGDIDNFVVKDLLIKLEETENALTEAQSRLQILSLLENHNPLLNQVTVNRKKHFFSDSVTHVLNVLLKENRISLGIYFLLPPYLKKSIRAWRSKKLMKNEIFL